MTEREGGKVRNVKTLVFVFECSYVLLLGCGVQKKGEMLPGCLSCELCTTRYTYEYFVRRALSLKHTHTCTRTRKT